MAGLPAAGGASATTAVKETMLPVVQHTAATLMLFLNSGADHDDSDSITANTDAAFVALELGCLVERYT